MKNLRLPCLVLAISVTILSCRNDDSAAEIGKYSWATSSISPNGSFAVSQFKIGSDGQLYAMAFAGNQRVFIKLIDNLWQQIAQANEQTVIDFTVFKDTIYYCNYDTLKKVRGTNKTNMNIVSNHFDGLEVFDNKLFLAGSPIQFKGGQYAVLSYDGNTFSPIGKEESQSGTMKKINNKLFIGGWPDKIFDGTNLSATNHYGGFLNVDKDEALYSDDRINNNDPFTFIRKFKDNSYQNVGGPIYTGIDGLEFNNQTTIICGINGNDKTLISKTYFLNSVKQWVQIETSAFIIDLINFNDRILAATEDGQILELVSK